MCARCIEWGGKRWHRYGEGRGSYYERTDKSVRPKRTRRLHREVWISHRGPVPAGFDVHHIDHDLANNDISNLECLPHGRHKALHLVDEPIPRTDWAKRPARVVPCADCGCDLRRKRVSAAPRCARCSQRRADENRKASRQCEQCGGAFASRFGNFCSQRCVNLATRGGTVRVLPEGSRRA